jgi:hypothetical protein
MRRLTAFFTSLLILCLSTTALAIEPCSVEFFASNNTATIDLKTAYQRLMGDEQQQLKDNMIGILQKNHIEQGKFEDILGTYQMVDNGSSQLTIHIYSSLHHTNVSMSKKHFLSRSNLQMKRNKKVLLCSLHHRSQLSAH